jgi:hypothetical protein
MRRRSNEELEPTIKTETQNALLDILNPARECPAGAIRLSKTKFATEAFI